MLIMALVITLSACNDDLNEETVGPDDGNIAVQFQVSELVIAENAAARPVILQLTSSAIQDGELTIDVSALSDKVELKPAAIDGILHLAVTRGDEFISFSINPVDNQIIDGDLEMSFRLESATKGLEIGTKRSIKAIIVDDEIPVTASFRSVAGKASENNHTGTSVTVELSGAAPGIGSLVLSFESDRLTYGTHYTTIPPAIDGSLTLPVPVGAHQVSFAVLPVDDALFNGDRALIVTLESAAGSVSKGAQNNKTITIADDELATKTKGYSISAGGWSLTREYSYNEDGTLARINWQKRTPTLSEGVIKYEYDSNGKVIKRIDNPVDEVFYRWEGNQIIKEETYRDGVLKQVNTYGYDAAGNIGEVGFHYRQEDGSFSLSLLFVYLYHNDGNIYKRLAYAPKSDSDEYTLLSTQTYEFYLDITNPFSMVEVLPNVQSQPRLPLTYRVEEGGKDIHYRFFYEFDDKGRPTQRQASSSVGSETAYYHYFE